MDLQSLIATALLRRMEPSEMPTVVPPNIRHKDAMPPTIKPLPVPESEIDPFIPSTKIPHKATETYWDRQKKRKAAFEKFFGSGKR